MEERRSYVRLDISVDVKYKIIPKNEPVMSGTTSDISAGGFRFFSKDKLEPGTKLNLEIVLPDQEKPVMAKGEVVWAEEFSILSENVTPVFETGVKFMGIAEKDRSNIGQYIFGQLKKRA